MLSIKGAKFITSAARAEQFIAPLKPMIAVCGKSNAGKSSLINMLANNKSLAKTSATPGRTRLVNYFDFGEFLLADLPGYGYAEASKEEQEKWGRIIDKFFERKGDISHVFILSDIRRDPSALDLKLIEFLNFHIFPFSVVATKCDKLSKMKVKERVQGIARTLGLGYDNILPTSALSGYGKDALLKKIEDIINAEEA